MKGLNTRKTKNRRDTLVGHMRHSNILGSRFKDLEDAERIAAILNPIGQAHKLGSAITGRSMPNKPHLCSYRGKRQLLR